MDAPPSTNHKTPEKIDKKSVKIDKTPEKIDKKSTKPSKIPTKILNNSDHPTNPPPKITEKKPTKLLALPKKTAKKSLDTLTNLLYTDIMDSSTQQITKEHVAALLARNSFEHFLPLAFSAINPGVPLEWNWHLQYLCHMLMRTTDPKLGLNPTPNDRIRKLIINIPPRSLKSVTGAAFKAFILGHDSRERFIGASYSARLALKLNSDLRAILTAPWYNALFPDTILLKETDQELMTTNRGLSFATSTGGTITGLGGNYIVADDLLPPDEAFSDTARRSATDWFNNTLYSRANDKRTAAYIVIMQRLHEDDLTGALIALNKTLPEQERWELVSLPALFTKETVFNFGKYRKTVKEGELLHINRDSLSSLEATKQQLGSYNFSAQYLQNPAPAEGGLLNPQKFVRYHPAEIPSPPHTHPEKLYITQSWDTAIKAHAHADRTVCMTFLSTPSKHYLLDVLFGKWEYPELLPLVQSHAQRFNADAILIEDRGSGQQLVQDLRRDSTLPVIPITASSKIRSSTNSSSSSKSSDRKILAAAAVSPMIEAGTVAIPTTAEQQPWWSLMENEMMFFPNSAHDDFVDSLTQYLQWAKSATLAFQARIRVL